MTPSDTYDTILQGAEGYIGGVSDLVGTLEELLVLLHKRQDHDQVCVTGTGRAPSKDPRVIELWKIMRTALQDGELGDEAYIDMDDIILLIEICPKSVLPKHFWPKDEAAEREKLIDNLALAYPKSILLEAAKRAKA